MNTRDQIDGLVYRVKLQLLYKDFYQNKRLLVHFQNSTTSSLISDLKKLRNKSDFNNLIIRCHNDETVAANRDILECKQKSIITVLYKTSIKTNRQVQQRFIVQLILLRLRLCICAIIAYVFQFEVPHHRKPGIHGLKVLH